MLRRSIAPVSIWFGVCASIVMAQGAARPLDVDGGVRSGRVVVSLKQESYQSLARLPGANPADILRDPRAFLDAGFKAAAAQWNVTAMRPLYLRPFRNPALAAQLGLDRVYVVNAPPGTDAQSMADSFALSADVELAFPDTIGGVALVPNDPEFPLQYGMDNSGQTAGGTVDADIDAVEAWSVHTGNLGTVTIAIIDSGVSPHSEFSTRLVAGINTADPGNPTFTTDSCPHGTHVAGIAAAAGDNGIGVAGVTWGANIMPVRVLDGCNGLISDLAAGIVWAADNGADVLNMSLQFYNLSLAEQQNLQNAANYAHGLGTILVAAAGNNNIGGVGVLAFPARLSKVLAVTATDNTDTIATFSNTGPQADLCAPGKDIRSTWIGDDYAYQFGTSMAAPHVSGVAALTWSFEPSISRNQLEEILRYSADDLGPVGWDQQYGQGRVNAWKTLDAVSCIIEAPILEAAAAEDVPFAKSRAISFQPQNVGRNTALRIRLVSLHHPDPPYSTSAALDYSALEGQYRWVGPSLQFVESTSSQVPFNAAYLQCTPHYADWGAIGLLHVFGAEIVPSSIYEVQAVIEGCPIASTLAYSSAFQVVTGRWGDLEIPFNPPANSQQPDVGDISALVNKFRSSSGAPTKARSIMAGVIPDLDVDLDFGHVSACVDSFRGLGFPYPVPAGCGP